MQDDAGDFTPVGTFRISIQQRRYVIVCSWSYDVRTEAVGAVSATSESNGICM
jgi:hypothetical protein